MLSIIIPCIRPIGRDRCIESIHKYAGIPDYLYEIVTEEDVNRIGSNLMIQRLTYKSQFDNVMFLGDDTEVTENCIPEAIKTMYEFEDKWGMVGLNDQFHDPNKLATHWMCHKKLLDYLGGEFLHTGYRHCFSDQELIDRCKSINRYKPVYKAIINHINPLVNNSVPFDNDYLRVYEERTFMHDKLLYKKRQKEGFRNAS